MSSTGARPSKDLIWLFFDPTKNPQSSAYIIPVPGHSLDSTHVHELDWAGALWKWFAFRAHGPSITFWKVGYRPGHSPLSMFDPVIQPSPPLLLDSIGVKWIADHPTIEDFCVRYQPAKLISGALGEPEHVHLLVMAEELTEDGELVGFPEERDSVEELPLQAIYRRKSQVLTPPFQIVLNLVRIPRSENTIIGPTVRRCHVEGVR